MSQAKFRKKIDVKIKREKLLQCFVVKLYDAFNILYISFKRKFFGLEKKFFF